MFGRGRCVDNQAKYHFRKILGQDKDNIKKAREALCRVDDSEVARRYLREAEFSILFAMHEIQGIGLKKEVVEEEIVMSDNPSA